MRGGDEILSIHKFNLGAYMITLKSVVAVSASAFSELFEGTMERIFLANL